MTKYLVSIDGAPAQETIVRPRTQKLMPGVLCEVVINDRFESCLIDHVATSTLTVRRLPEMRTSAQPTTSRFAPPLAQPLAPTSPSP